MSYLSDLLGNAYTEGMTEDEISAALEARDNNKNTEFNRLKAALSKANSEAADYKRQLRTKQSDEEAAETARKEEHEKLLQENAELKRSIALSEKKAKLISMGYAEKLATETAEAMVDGDMDKVLVNQGVYLETQKKDILAEAMRKTPRPAPGADNSTEDYGKMISEAQASGDMAAAAYYTRLQALSEAQMNQT